MKLLHLLKFSSFIFLMSPAALGAACCGGGFAAPSIIAGDDRAQISTSLSHTEVVVDNVDAQGLWRSRSEHQQVQNFRLEGAFLLSDLWQMGLSLPLIQRSYTGKSFSGIGDIATTLGYEYLPDWDYNPYRPKGLGFLQLTLPTGKSRAESEDGLDSRGQGFLSLSLGTLLTKSWQRLDAFVNLEGHRSFPKDFSNGQTNGTLEPGYGGNFGGGIGYNSALFRYGVSAIWTYEDAVKIFSANTSSGSIERYATASASISYLPNDEWSGSLTYSDQTLIGEPVNTSLGKSIAIQMQHRWGR